VKIPSAESRKKKEQNGESWHFVVVVKRIQCTATRINANARPTREREKERERERERGESERKKKKERKGEEEKETEWEGKHGRVVGIKGKLLSYFHSRQRSLEFKSDTSAHHFARPTFFMILLPAPRHFSAGGFVSTAKSEKNGGSRIVTCIPCLFSRSSLSSYCNLAVTIISAFTCGSR
jgi:hypothetical protein